MKVLLHVRRVVAEDAVVEMELPDGTDLSAYRLAEVANADDGKVLELLDDQDWKHKEVEFVVTARQEV